MNKNVRDVVLMTVVFTSLTLIIVTLSEGRWRPDSSRYGDQFPYRQQRWIGPSTGPGSDVAATSVEEVNDADVE